MISTAPVGIWTFGHLWGQESATVADAGEMIAEIEELGYGGLWLGRADGIPHLTGALLSMTRTLIVGTSIVNIWINPAREVATDYSQVASLYPGRLIVGLGVSHPQFVEPTGQRYIRPLQRMRSYLDALDSATPTVPSGSRALAALGPRMLELSGQRSAGALPYLTTPEHTRRAREILGPDALLVAEQKVVLDRNVSSARELARGGIKRYLQRPNYASNLQSLGFSEEDRANGGSDRIVDSLVAWGDETAIRKRVQEHLEAGANHVAVQILTENFILEKELPRREWQILAPALLSRLRPDDHRG
jgi:probable F420-dependent oxidoreductase